MTVKQFEPKKIYIRVNQATPPTDWLLWWWKLEEDANDYSGNNKNWTRTWTASYSEVWWKTAAVFSSSNYITTSLSYASLPITICAWEYLNTTWSSTYPIVENSKSNTTSFYWLTRYPWSNLVRWWSWGSVDLIDYTYSVRQQRNFWALTIDSSWNKKLYLNGELVKIWTWWAAATQTQAWKIWNWYTNSSTTLYKWIWYIKNVAIYNKALSAEEVLSFYQVTQ